MINNTNKNKDDEENKLLVWQGFVEEFNVLREAIRFRVSAQRQALFLH